MRKKNKILRILSFILLIFFLTVTGYTSNQGNAPLKHTQNEYAQDNPFKDYNDNVESIENSYMIGTGVYDITGPPAEVMFGGMVDFEQKGEGLFMRLRSRAFIIKDTYNGKSIVLVNTELGASSQGIQLEVIKRLKDEFGDLYTEKNVAMSASHTHSAPGGYFNCWILSTAMGMGFCEENFYTIVNGIVESIKRAHNNLSMGKIYLNSDFSSHKEGERYGRNRSIEAYNLNPTEEREKYKIEGENIYDVTNRRMTVLKFVRADGTEIGMYNWAAVHPHVSGQFKKLINGDSKGYASYLFEKDHGTDYLAENTFVAAFAMNDAGDSSSNLPEDAVEWGIELDEKGNYPAKGVHDYERMKKRGITQYNLARKIYDNATDELTGSVDFRQMYVNFSNFKIDSSYISPYEVRYHEPDFVDEDIDNCRLCEPVMGFGMFSGSTEDSYGLIANEGNARDVTDNPDLREFIKNPFKNGLFDLIWGLFMPREMIQEDRDCHLEKINALHMGRGEELFPNGKAVTEILPIQILNIGKFAIAALPFEVTTMAGRRIRDDIKNVMDNVTHVEINAITGAFTAYLTTRDEYSIQHYEGGSNWFGPYSLNGVRQMFSELALTFFQDNDFPDYALTINDIRNTLDNQKILVGKVEFDNKPVCKEFGDVITQPNPFYNKNNEDETVIVEFWGGHPNNNFQTQSTYLVVERKIESDWKTVAMDWDLSTFFHWKKMNNHMSQIKIEWKIPEDTIPGEYRIRHFGNWKSHFTRKVFPYTGISESFMVE
jgi:neutral ceramidase